MDNVLGLLIAGVFIFLILAMISAVRAESEANKKRQKAFEKLDLEIALFLAREKTK